eukprot:m.11964 g.11964  ORF g.11964 m.11964 type:complete len:712 (+) comp2895_c0_seq1:126-2261(+)
MTPTVSIILLATVGHVTQVSLTQPALRDVGILAAGERLTAGQAITSGNGYMVMQPSGVLAVCSTLDPAGQCQDTPQWTAVGPEGPVPNSTTLMAECGVLELHVPNGTRVWWTHTMALCGCTPSSTNCGFVTMQRDGNAVLYAGTPDKVGKSVWFTGTHFIPPNAKNVLHLVVDDLRPAMNVAYKQEYMHTPSFDRLANEGLVFLRAYTGIAVCAPSRNSFMSGLRPDVTAIFNFNNHIREPGQPPIVTTPQQFRKAGWNVLGGGKTFHFNVPPYFDGLADGSWSCDIQPYYPFYEYVGSSDMAYCPINGTLLGGGIPGASMCVIDGDESQLYDYRLMNHTVNTIARVAAMPQPWYVMAGFRRPHRDWEVHRKYWDLYPDASTFATAKIQTRTESQPLVAFHAAGFTLTNGTGVQGNPDMPWPLSVQQLARKAYASAVTQTDAYVGRVLDALDATGQENKTIVILHSDHGWQLGEHGLWDKQTEFELATRVPLIIKVPWKLPSVGKSTSAFAELVDLHPTIAALAGLAYSPPTQLPDDVKAQGTGQDLSPVFDNPELTEAQPGKNASYSQWPVCTRNASQMCMACTGPQSSRVVIKAMGYSVRTDTWRYTVWLPLNTTLFVGDFSADPIAVELYDHHNSSPYNFDIDGEANNLANDPSYAGIQQQLHNLVQAQYTWNPTWLARSRLNLQHGQLNNDLQNGFYPYTGTLPVPP